MNRQLRMLSWVFALSSLGVLVADNVEIVENIDPRYAAPGYVAPSGYVQPGYVAPGVVPAVVPATPYGQPSQMVIPTPYVQQPPVANPPPAVNYFRPQYNQFDPNYSAWQSYQLIMLPDQRTVDRVRSAISRDRYLAQLLPNIQIYASGGVITLAGAVPSTSVRTKIEMLAKQTNGVYRVDNQLVLIRPQRPYIVPQSTAIPKR